MRYDVIVISPHLDDAAIGLTGKILELKAAGNKIMMLTVFTKAGKKKGDVGELESLIPKKYKNVMDWYKDRRNEENLYSRKVGADIKMLGLPEAAFRGYDFEDLFVGKIKYFDWKVLIKLWLIIVGTARWVKKGTLIYLPAGMNNHVDHVLVKKVGRLVYGKRARLWDDRYRRDRKIKVDGASVVERIILKKKMFDLKYKLLKIFKSEELIFEKILSPRLIKNERIFR